MFLGVFGRFRTFLFPVSQCFRQPRFQQCQGIGSDLGLIPSCVVTAADRLTQPTLVGQQCMENMSNISTWSSPCAAPDDAASDLVNGFTPA